MYNTRQAMYMQGNIQARSGNHFCSGKAISITCSECVFIDLIIQHAVRMRHIVSCGLPDLKYLYTSSHERYDFRKKNLLNTKCVLIFSTNLTETFLILRRIE